MKLDKFVLTYNGNKYREAKKLTFIDVNDYDIIIEPFCGIFGLSRALLELNPDYKGEFWLNDIDTELIDFYKQIQAKDYSVIDEHTYPDTMTNKDLNGIIKGMRIPTLIYKFSIGNVCSTIRGVAKIKNFNANKKDFETFLPKCKFSNQPHTDFLASLPKDKRILIFYDPPYLNSTNTEYTKYCEKNGMVDGMRQTKDVTQLYLDIVDSFNGNPQWSHLLIINDCALLHRLYMDYFREEYGKTYGVTFKSTEGNGKCKATHRVYFREGKNESVRD
jgi:site-specific DNA-adenine methylase